MTDYLTRTCPVCGGRLCVDIQYPDRVFCDTCDYEEPGTGAALPEEGEP